MMRYFRITYFSILYNPSRMDCQWESNDQVKEASFDDAFRKRFKAIDLNRGS